jgi:hypothetical protein
LFRQLLFSNGVSQDKPTMLYTDNQNAIWLVKNREYHKQTKHIISYVKSGKQSRLNYHMFIPMTQLLICWLSHYPNILV